MMNKIATLATNKNKERVIKIQFPYNVELIYQIRLLTGRVYHKENDCWSAPVLPSTVQKLKELGFEVSDAVIKALNESDDTAKLIMSGIPGLKGQPYEFQKEGIVFIERNSGRALVADEMGLGKTIQALAWLQLHPELRPVIIVCPASLKLNWRKEAKAWLSKCNVQILSGTTPYTIKEPDIIIINYDILAEWWKYLKGLNPKVIIADECHYFKTNSAKRTKAIKMLSKGVPYFIGLSGTPIVNKPIEALNAIRIINPKLFPDPWKFMKRYCKAHRTGFGLDYSGSSNEQELHRILTDTIMIRRLKKDVLKDLPPKRKCYVPMALSNQAEYDSAEADFIGFIEKTKGVEAAERASNAEAFAQINLLRQLAIKGKLKQAIEWIKDFLEVEDKLIVFAIHKSTIAALMKSFGDIAVKVDGSVSLTHREKAKERFQNDPKVKLFVGNIQAAGVGLTLTAASNVVFLELPWSPGVLVQAEDRSHRIGQTKEVTIYFLLADGTIENRIAELLDDKNEVLSAILDGKKYDTQSMLQKLIQSYVPKEKEN